MAKRIKNVLMSLFVMFAFMFAGIFFFGCNVDYSIIKLTTDKATVSLEVGESVDVIVTIENFQKGFSNRINVDAKTSGQSAVFSVSDPVYMGDDKIKLTITGVAGGEGKMVIKTFEAEKECSVDVSVSQYTSSMAQTSNFLYVSNKTDFVPTDSMFVFDPNTTNKNLVHFLIVPQGQDINFNTYKLKTLNEQKTSATFVDVSGQLRPAEKQIVQFDRTKLRTVESKNVLSFFLKGNLVKEIDFLNNFHILSVYQHSIDNEEIINCVSSVFALENLNVQITGGYINADGSVDFEEINSDIKIVPNNNKMIQYLLRVEMNQISSSEAAAKIKLEINKSNNFVVVDFDDDFKLDVDEGKNVKYIKISQNSQTQATTKLDFKVYYDIAKDIHDESVSVQQSFDIKIEIAPKNITVNGALDGLSVKLYNFYLAPEFGWQDLLVDVISNFNTSPNFDGIYFEFEEDKLDLIHNGVAVSSSNGSGRLYRVEDLNKPFQIRGKRDAPKSDTVLKVHLISDILEAEDELPPFEIYCQIVEGAKELRVDRNYSDCEISYFALDVEAGSQPFDEQIFASSEFRSVNITCLSENDVVDLIIDKQNLFTEKERNFYLNLKVTPKRTGTATYNIALDNGVSKTISFNCVKILNLTSSPFKMTKSGNDAVTAVSLGRKEGSTFDNVLNLEILNPSTKDFIDYGNVANFEVIADTIDGGVRFEPNDSSSIFVSNVGGAYRVTTKGNGDTEIQFHLTGLKVEDFRDSRTSVDLFVNVSSYSLVDEFFLMNGSSYALNNTVYYSTSGTMQEESSTLKFNAVANHQNSKNFFQYRFNAERFAEIFKNARFVEGQNDGIDSFAFDLTASNFNDYVSYDLIHETYLNDSDSDKFVFFFAKTGMSNVRTAMNNVIVTRVDTGEKRRFTLNFYNGLMFRAKNFNFIDVDETGKNVVYQVSFDNVYRVGPYGEFDMSNFTYKHTGGNRSYTIVLNANLRQREWSKEYDARITATQYQSVKRISLASGTNTLDFTNNNLETTIGVYTYPTYATNNKLNIEYIPTSDNEYAGNMLKFTLDDSKKENGIFSITLSCKDFYEKFGEGLVDLNVLLSGRLYIYPSEWGKSYTAISATNKPIVIDIHYRNGSKLNPYILETAEDVLNINSNETTLKSHYEIKNVISLNSVENTLPIGVLKVGKELKLIGFSGSIVGSTSQAAITNINLKNDNFFAEISNKNYAGLFALLNSKAEIENVTFGGQISLALENKTSYIGLLSSINKGHLTNVSVQVGGSESAVNSSISTNGGTLYFGAVAALNYGKITQDFRKYDGTGYVYLQYSKNVLSESYNFVNGIGFVERKEGDIKKDDFGFFVEVTEDENVKKIRVDENGFVLDESGLRKKYQKGLDKDGNEVLSSLPSMLDFSGLTSKNISYFNSELSISVFDASVFAGGVSGANGGEIERILPTRESYKLYGYAAYTAFTKLKVSGDSNAKNIYVGGISGALANVGGILENALAETLLEGLTAKLENLLVGGKIDAFDVADSKAVVGGIAGLANAKGKNQDVYILKNVSRTFLRASGYIGGILGEDGYTTDAGAGYNVQFNVTAQDETLTQNNKVQAVDAGDNAFESAMMISSLQRENIPEKTEETNERIFFSIGNQNERNYRESGIDFEIVSYVDRTLTPFDENPIYPSANPSTTSFYGDFLVAKKDATNQSYVIEAAAKFKFEQVSLGEITGNKMSSVLADAPDLFFMYYFSVSGLFNEGISQEGVVTPQEQIDALNFFTPENEQLYPFKLSSEEVTISTSSSTKLNVDLNGNLTTKNVGLATIKLSSILNVVKSQTIYVYIYNYFDKNVQGSIFYTNLNGSGDSIASGSDITVVGNSYTNVFLVPSYNLTESKTQNNDTYSISQDGILNFNNVDYVLNKNSEMEIESEFVPVTEGKGPDFSKLEVINQTAFFSKDFSVSNLNGVDEYSLVPVLKVSIPIGQKIYEYYYVLDKSEINLRVRYQETATAINTVHTHHSMKTNEDFSDVVTIHSTNPEELLFYQIFNDSGLVQSRLPENLGEYFFDEGETKLSYDEYLNLETSKDLFDFNFERRAGTNIFDFVCRINTESTAFKDRLKKDESGNYLNNIYGTYHVRLYSSELDANDAVYWDFSINLQEAELNYVTMKNFSTINDLSASDQILVPSQYGMLEVSLDPVEAVFEEFKISNNQLNSQEGATKASFVFVYEKHSENSSVEFVQAPYFGRHNNDGSLSFTYQELIDFLNSFAKEENVSLYLGKVYVAYFMPSTNVEDGVKVGFDVSVSYGNRNEVKTSFIELTTKLSSYAKLVFDEKESYGGSYYLAKGLSYNLSLQYYGFSEDQIEILTDSEFVSISGANGKYRLEVTSGSVPYNNVDPGFKVTVTTRASKMVDNVEVVSEIDMTIYIMEYVMNYAYAQGFNEDIVRGMSNGIISTAVGNPYTLEFSIVDFLEFDKTNQVVQKEVETFVREMTGAIEWKVYFENKEEKLETGKYIRGNDYFYINSFTVTPIRIYKAESNVYHFSAGANYIMQGGVYAYSITSINANKIYTEFVFDVHQQSTDESPIPVNNFEELMEMEDDAWYILLDNIELPSKEYVAGNGGEQFKPITANIAGLDGNGYRIEFAGTYDFAEDVGLFSKVSENAVLKNIEIHISSNTTFVMNASSYNVGLLAISNEGIITNCSVQSDIDSSGKKYGLSVVSTVSTNSSYVAGFVAENNGFITNSRSKLEIFSMVSVSGFVAQNYGLIASSYYADASLTNETNSAREYTAGFVINNNGKIYTSYTSGVSGNSQQDANSVYYSGLTNSIESSNNMSGFAFTNSGEIFDCYSNVHMQSTGAFSSGFVFENSGLVERCFSTSLLQSGQTSNYGFARSNSVTTGEGDSTVVTNGGRIFDCFYLYDENINVNIGEIASNANTVITPLKIAEFSELEKYFSNFVIANGRSMDSVWFFNDNKDSNQNFNGSYFNTGRLELAAPNVVASSKRRLERMETVSDPVTGATYTRYVYVFKDGSEPLGTKYNPILVDNAENFEKYIIQENDSSNVNHSYYRLISDISYSDYLFNSATFKTKFLGFMEGNFMTVSGQVLFSSEAMDFAGIFAEIGSSEDSQAVGTLMNVTFNPTTVTFANAKVVGAIAGKIDSAKVLNVRVESNSDTVTVEGNNIVGGAIGLTTGNFKMQNVYSQFSAKARRQYIQNDNVFDANSNDFSDYSFAGSIVGVASGRGAIYNSVTDTSVTAIASKAGLMFGFIDAGVNVEKVELQMQQTMVLNGYNYAGFVVGETKGTVRKVVVNGTNSVFTNIRKVPFVPDAFGGFAGLISGGVVDDVAMTQSISVSAESSSTGIKYVGGIAGIINARAMLSNLTVSATLEGFTYVGGIAGKIDCGTNVVAIKQINLTCNLYVYGTKLQELAIGGIVAEIAERSILNISSNVTEEISSLEVELVRLKNQLTNITDENEKKALEKNIAEKESALTNLKNNSKLKNNLVVSANARVYAYEEAIHTYVGTIYGFNKSANSHTVYDVISTITGEIHTESIGLQGILASAKLSTMKNEDEIVELKLDDEAFKGVLNEKMLTATRSQNACFVTFTTILLAKTSGEINDARQSLLELNLFGQIVEYAEAN